MYVGCLWSVKRKKSREVYSLKNLPLQIPASHSHIFAFKRDAACAYMGVQSSVERKEEKNQREWQRLVSFQESLKKKIYPDMWQCKITENSFPLPPLLHKGLWKAHVAPSEGVAHREGKEVGATVSPLIHMHDIYNWELPDFKLANEHPGHTQLHHFHECYKDKGTYYDQGKEGSTKAEGENDSFFSWTI